MFTDADIIQALECCKMPVGSGACNICPIKDIRNKAQISDKSCTTIMLENTLDLIERQQAEIEKLKETPKCVYEYDGEVTEYCVQSPCPNFKTVDEIKAEAIKEFAEKLKKYEKFHYDYEANLSIYYVDTDIIDNLVKEMVGDTE